MNTVDHSKTNRSQVFTLVILILVMAIHTQCLSQTIGFRTILGDITLEVWNHPNLDLNELVEKYSGGSDTINFGLNIYRSTVTSKAYFYQKVFLKDIRFDSVTFTEKIHFSSCRFAGNIDFSEVKYLDGLSMMSCSSKGRFDVRASFFHDFYSLMSSYKDFNLNDSKVDEVFTLTGGTIDHLLILGSEFYGRMSLSKLNSKYIYLGFNEFETFYFTDNSMPYENGLLRILKPFFRGDTYISNNLFPNYVEFTQVESEKDINLIHASGDTLKKPLRINLLQSDISKIRMLYGYPFQIGFEGSLHPDELNSVYTALIKNQKDAGFFKSYVLLDKEYQHYHNTIMTGGFIGHLKDFLQFFWWGYGHDKHRILYFTPFTLVLLSFLAFFPLEILLKEGYDIKYISKRLYKSKSRTQIGALWIRWKLSFAYMAIIFFGFHLSFDRLKFKNLYIAFFISTIHVVGLVYTGFMANYIILS